MLYVVGRRMLSCLNIRIYAKRQIIFFSKVAFNIILIIAGALLISGFLRNIQHQTALYKQKANSEKVLDETIRILKESSRSMRLKQVL